MNEQKLEQKIQEKGKTAPRVTPDKIEALLARVQYLGGRVPGTTSTIVHAFLDGEFLLGSGHSACVSAENFDEEIGFELASDNARKKGRDQLWQLEGYLLRVKLAEQFAISEEEAARRNSTGLAAHQLRVVDELNELQGKIDKLAVFIGGQIYNALDISAQHTLDAQLGFMTSYAETLRMRIDAF